MIRHYEKLGLIPPASRRASGYREYTDAEVSRLAFIARARSVGFALDEIAGLLIESGSKRASRVAGWLTKLDGKADDVRALRRELEGMAEG